MSGQLRCISIKQENKHMKKSRENYRIIQPISIRPSELAQIKILARTQKKTISRLLISNTLKNE